MAASTQACMAGSICSVGGQHLLGCGEQGHLGFLDLEGLGCVDQILHDGNLLIEIGKRDYGHVTENDELVVVGVVQHAYVAEDGLGRKKALLLVQDTSHVLVGRAETLHQDIALSLAYHEDCLRDGGQLIVVVDDSKYGRVDLLGLADLLDHVDVTHEGSVYDTEFHGLIGCRDGVVVHGPCRDQTFAGL